MPEVDLVKDSEMLSFEDYKSRADAVEQGKEVPELKPTDTKTIDDKVADDTEVVDDKKVVEAKPDDKPTIDKRTREGRKLSIQQEIDQLTTQRHDSQRDFDAAQLKLAQLRADVAELEAKKALAGKPAEVKTDTQVTQKDWQRFRAMPDAPKLEDFADSETQWDDWNAATVLFVADKRFEERMQQHTGEQRERARFDAWRDRLEKAKAADPTIATRLTSDTPSTAQMRDFIIDSALGVELALYLSEHKSDAQRIATLHPLKVAEELATVVAQLKAQKPHGDAANSGPALIAVSQAKPPIKPVDGSPNVSDEVDEGDLPPDEFIRRANKRDGIAMPSAARR